MEMVILKNILKFTNWHIYMFRASEPEPTVSIKDKGWVFVRI